MYQWKHCLERAVLVMGAYAIVLCAAGSAAALGESAAGDCTGVVSGNPKQMYDFKLGDWDIALGQQDQQRRV